MPKKLKDSRRKTTKQIIIEQCEAVGTYKDAFLPAIEATARTIEQRDAAWEAFVEDGCRYVIDHTNKADNTNLVKNPLFLIWRDLNMDALAMWRELGLTPSGYKKVTGDNQSQKKGSALAAALKSFET